MLVEDSRLAVTSTRASHAVTRSTARPARKSTRTETETDQIRDGLRARLAELDAEYTRTVAESQSLSREQMADAAGDDDADSGTKTSERERELSLIRTFAERREQVEHALERLAEGAYGWCEGCAGPIPVDRLGIFPWATSCVGCQQTRERRAG